MKKYEKNIEDRKVLVARLSELTGQSAHYTRVPRCAYEIGAFTVEKDGSLMVEDGADESIIETLISENMIGAGVDIEAPAPEAAAGPALSQNGGAGLRTDSIDTEDWDEGDEESEDEAEEDGGGEECLIPPETPEEAAPAEDLPEEDPDSTPELPAQEAETEPEPQVAGDGSVPDEEHGQEDAEELAVSLRVREEEEDNGFPVDAEIGFPLEKHTAASLINLVCTIYTRGPLLSKATGGEFRADAGLVSQMTDHMAFRTREEAAGFIRGYGGDALTGIRFEEDKLVFDGFKKVKDAGHLQTFTRLAEAINRTALTQKRVLAKAAGVENEKYAMRTWLIRIGMDGSDTKEDRKRLMENLTGHTAFRTPADEAKWKARQQAKRDALRAAKTETEEAE